MRKQPKIGDLVRAIGPAVVVEGFKSPGLVIDSFELEGINNFEVLFDNGDIAWFTDIEVRVINK